MGYQWPMAITPAISYHPMAAAELLSPGHSARMSLQALDRFSELIKAVMLRLFGSSIGVSCWYLS